MTTHDTTRIRLRDAIQAAILDVGTVPGATEAVLTNTDVTEALLEVLGAWAAAHSFEDFTPSDLAKQYAEVIEAHIRRLGPALRSGQTAIKIIPRSKVN